MYLNQIKLMLCGEGNKIEVEEIVISKKGIIREPTSTDDSWNYIVLICAIIDQQRPEKFSSNGLKVGVSDV